MILPFLNLDLSPTLNRHFLPYQVNWIEAEDMIHAQKLQAFALAEKSIRIGWTYADAFKNVRKRLRFRKRDYLFATKDYPSALEYMKQAWEFAELFDLTSSILSHGEESLKIPRLDDRGRPGAFTEEVKVGVIKFDNGSRIIAFSSNPQAMAVYGGDVGLDEFAKHPNAQLLWETAQGRVTWGFDLAVWSAHDGEDTLFYQFAQQARLSSIASAKEDAACDSLSAEGRGLGEVPSFSSSSSLAAPKSDEGGSSSPQSVRENSCEFVSSQNQVDPCESVLIRGSLSSQNQNAVPSVPENQRSTLDARLSTSPSATLNSQSASTISSPWNLYYHVTIEDAINSGLLDRINAVRGTKLTPARFLGDCRARAGLEEIFQQSYLCNAVPRAASIVDWSAIERCRFDYAIDRLHLEHDQIQKQFGPPSPHDQLARESSIRAFLHQHFTSVFLGRTSSGSPAASPEHREGGPLSAPGRGTKREVAVVSNPQSSNQHPVSLNLPSTFDLRHSSFRLGFDVAASGRGDLAAFYLDATGASLSALGRGLGEVPSFSSSSSNFASSSSSSSFSSSSSSSPALHSAFDGGGSSAYLLALLTCRTDDWHFLKTVLFTFLRDLPNIQGCGDESGLGRQICWEAANHFGQNKFTPINFATRKSYLGLLLMNLLSSGQKRFPRSHQDVAADFFALRKSFNGTRWIFNEGRNNYNTASHCDIAWAGALASEANVRKKSNAWAMLG
jgi:phage FluMu gp28-like protein